MKAEFICVACERYDAVWGAPSYRIHLKGPYAPDGDEAEVVFYDDHPHLPDKKFYVTIEEVEEREINE